MTNYLTALKEMLDRFDMDKAEKEDIYNDYYEMIEEARTKYLTDEEIINKLGNIEAIYRELKTTYKLKKKIQKSEKIIGIMPFISLIVFMLLGFYGYWHPGWLVFLSIPMTAIIIEGLNNDPKYKLTSISPFISVILFIILGFNGFWHPGWLIFLLTPVMGIIESKNTLNLKSLCIGLSVFIGFTAFIILSIHYDIYHPTWVLLLSPIFIATITEHNKKVNLIIGITLVFTIASYIFLGTQFISWSLALLVFIPYIVLLILYNRLNIVINISPSTPILKGTMIISLLVFVLLGSLQDVWHPTWLVLLSIPVVAIIENEKNHRLTAVMPFISVTLFILIGTYFDAWHPAWLVFLLIPIAGVLED